MADFTGFPADGMDFYAALDADNSKAFWTANRQRYEDAVRAPITALVTALEPEFGEARVFRPYRDVRFSADKRAYKDRQGAFVPTVESMGYYVQIGARGVTAGGGLHHYAPDQVARLRAAVDAERTGAELEGLLDGLDRGGFEVGGDRVATRPRGVSADHPRLALMRHKSLIVWRDHGRADWLSTPAALDRIRDDWRAIGPLLRWLATQVGPATDTRPARRR